MESNVSSSNINQSDSPTLCLCMIVKNESKIITRMFDSVINMLMD